MRLSDQGILGFEFRFMEDSSTSETLRSYQNAVLEAVLKGFGWLMALGWRTKLQSQGRQ